MMMKKLACLMLLLVAILSSCGIPNTSYELDVETFESFYDVDYRLTEDGAPKLIVELTPKTKLKDVDLTINLTIYLSLYYDDIRYFDAIAIEMPIGTSQTIYEKDMPYNDRVVLRGYSIDQVSGVIKAPSDIELQSKTYDNTFDINHQIKEGSLYDNIILFESLVEVLDEYNVYYQNMYRTTSVIEQTMIYDGEETTESMVSETTAIKTPFFYQEITDLGYGTEISGLNDTYYMYYWGEDKALDKSVVDYEMLGEIDVDMFKNLAFDQEGLALQGLSPTFVKITKDQDTYHLSLNFMDFASEEPMLKELFDELKDMDVELNLDDIVIEMSLSFRNLEIETSLNMTLEFYEDMLFILSINDIDNFEDFEVPYVRNNKKNYVMRFPSEFDQVTEETDFSVIVEQADPSETHMYYGYIEKGVYDFDCTNRWIHYSIYDHAYNLIEFEQNPTILNSNFFEIEESGYYYLRLSKNDYQNYGFRLVNKDLSDYVNTPILIIDGMTESIHVESSDDLIKLIFLSDQKAVVHFDFDLSDEIIIYEGLNRNQPYTEVVTSTYSYGADQGENMLYIKASKEVIGTVSFEVVDIPNIYINHKDVMAVVDTSFFEEDFYYGRILGTAYFRLDVPEGDLYMFHLLDGSAQIAKDMGGYLTTPKDIEDQTQMYLYDGIYIIKFDDDDLAINNIKYEILDIENIENQITLSRVDYLAFDYHLLDVYETNHLYPKQTVSYEFTLDQAETIYVNPGNVKLYNEQGDFLYPYPEDNRFPAPDTYIYHLETGTYSVVHDANSNYLEIAILDNLPFDDNPFLDPLRMTNTGTVSFYKDHDFDVDFVLYTITESGTYQFEGSHHTYLFHETDGYLEQLYRFYTYPLEPGNYMLYTSSFDKQVGEHYTLTVTKVDS